jgi:hypothetical protein
MESISTTKQINIRRFQKKNSEIIWLGKFQQTKQQNKKEKAWEK